MGTGPLTEEEASEALLALEEECNEAKRVFQDGAPAAARRIVHISHFSNNERTALSASQYVIDRVLGRIQDTQPKGVANPYRDVMREIVGELSRAADVERQMNEFIHQEEMKPDPGDKRHEGKIRDIYKELDDGVPYDLPNGPYKVED